ncbi:hypothetical protein JM66_14455 [Aeromonas bestiarum]|nr:hypothetical protein JM66_14455 [Aeromonas bestiarum]
MLKIMIFFIQNPNVMIYRFPIVLTCREKYIMNYFFMLNSMFLCSLTIKHCTKRIPKNLNH